MDNSINKLYNYLSYASIITKNKNSVLFCYNYSIYLEEPCLFLSNMTDMRCGINLPKIMKTCKCLTLSTSCVAPTNSIPNINYSKFKVPRKVFIELKYLLNFKITNIIVVL